MTAAASQNIDDDPDVLAGRRVQRVFAARKPGGRFLFSVEHPMCTAHPAGWVKDDGGNALHWLVDRYCEPGYAVSCLDGRAAGSASC